MKDWSYAGTRGSQPLTSRPMKLVPVERGDKVRGGKRSRRMRKFKWVAA